MEFDFLLAADGTPITKSFTKQSDQITVTPYPHVRNVNSYRAQAADTAELLPYIQEFAAAGAVMLKGLLDRPLRNESRAGHTQSYQPTNWMLLDLDFNEGWPSVDAFLAELNPEWANVSYIWQYSPSVGTKYSEGMRGHLWLLLDQPVSPDVLKQWLRERNFSVPNLRDRLELTATCRSLRFPLDVTTCQADKLLFIAPPVCQGFHDMLTERITHVKKDREFAPVPVPEFTPALTARTQEECIAELRTKAGLKDTKPKYKDTGSIPYLRNPEPVIVTGVHRARGFTYLNLNGGDSWGYYFPDENIEILRNFKDEPFVQLRDIAPGFYWAEHNRRSLERQGDIQPYVFREPYSDQYFNVLYDPGKERCVRIATAGSKDKLKDFLRQYSKPLPDPVEDWTVEFDPSTTEVIAPDNRWMNMFEPSEYLLNAKKNPPCYEMPPITDKILTSIAGDDVAAKERFVNWLAIIFQMRKRTETAWIFHGIEGTGKGLLLSRILRPLFGPKQVTEWTTQNFEEQFNASLEHTCILWFDEFKVSSAKSPDMLMNKLNNIITEATIPIRAMRQDTRTVPNHLNVIIATNHADPVPLSESDRRFNICPPQESTLIITDEEVDSIEAELPTFANYLFHRPVDLDEARKPIQGEARDNMIAAAQTTTTLFFRKLRTGELEWFAEFLNDGNTPPRDPMRYAAFESVMHRWIKDALNFYYKKGETPRLTRSDILALYDHVIGPGLSDAKITRMCRINRMALVKARHPDIHTLNLVWATAPRVTSENAKYFEQIVGNQRFHIIPGGKDKDDE